MPTTQFLARTLDPLHIGAGKQRLGRVDMTVVRDPVANVPIIPGTSLSGALKFFADYMLRDEGVKGESCAGVAGSERKHPREQCPICCAFGYTVESKDESSSGVADGGGGGASAKGILDFTDALLLAYPVNTFAGPVWLTTGPRLMDILGVEDGEDSQVDGYRVIAGSALSDHEKLNFGWVMLEKETTDEIVIDETRKSQIGSRVAERLVIVPEWIFTHLVNDNMEVRTSVVIDPMTGAAKNTGLFTYESAVRGSIFGFSVTESDLKGERWANVDWNHCIPTDSATKMLEDKAFHGVRAVGMGGMSTRGFGRLSISVRNGIVS